MFNVLDVTTLGHNLATSALPTAPALQGGWEAGPLRAGASRVLRAWARRLDPQAR
ncbi:hypothetical protein G7070_15205 [Propioniciclava coleopterorum]|uniref:Uncharacterized protein n=1 Tax=Propioniciclava coleopterorum TaxID=2714937 RepID=A0A6G7Y8Z4_9ACTN|nr:hypothetical protein [Propioniciclava coleopterorum]QIK73364.1 hypothetical protein G7070_15205 [Propioniciclava coleopterorum]